MRKPSNNPVTLPFGSSAAPYSAANTHKGTDFSYKPDDTIYAPFAGRVSQVPNNGNDGNGTYMTDSQGRYHGLLHASRYLVPNGSNVAEGQAIAVMGSTGYAQGVHLHWAVKQNGQFIDPMSLIKEGEQEVKPDPNQIKFLLAMVYRGQPITDDDAKALAGKANWADAINAMLTDGRAQRAYDSVDNAIDGTPPGGTPPGGTANVKPYSGPALYIKE